MNPPDDMVAVVGGSGSIGMEVIRAVNRRGVGSIISTYCHVEPPDSGICRWTKLDVRSIDECQSFGALVEALRAPLLALIYCTGIASSKEEIACTRDEEWSDLFEVNCLGFVRVYSALKSVTRQNGSRVVVLSSDTTRVLGARNGPYTASKAALESLVPTIAKEECDFGVRVNAVAPSLVESRLAEAVLRLKGVTNVEEYVGTLPWGQMMRAEAVAELTASIALDDCWDYVTGQIVRMAAFR